MKIPIYQVDAFTSDVFSGNPAAVCLLDSWLGDKYLQSIAAENNLSETAFLVRNADGFDIRWFTPITEIALCGHATLASAFVLSTFRQWTTNRIDFATRKSGRLVVTRQDHLFEMDFPARPAIAQGSPAGLNEALRITPEKVYVFEPAGDRPVVMAVLADEKAVKAVQPDFSALAQVDCRGAIITAKGDSSDFVSRYFAPRVGVPEDPVTGSAHCVLIPYWAQVLGKNVLHAFQVSKRGGELFCANAGERVKIAGKAVLYLEGIITISNAEPSDAPRQ